MTAAEWSAGAAGPALRALAGQDELYDWRDDALCAEVDYAMFFPEKGASTREAKSVCRSCPVRTPCLEYALEIEARKGACGRFGIWGATSPRERATLVRLERERVERTAA